MMRASFGAFDESNSPSTSTPPLPPHVSHPPLPYPTNRQRVSNVFQLLAQREVSPQTKRASRRFWGDSHDRQCDSVGPRCEAARDAKRGLISWVEAESLRHLSAKYCPLLPPPRSTIAAAFSPDGRTLASTHGDHTVKIIDCQTGTCLKVLSGHRRTPWVVRFHPLYPEILASGSLDYDVRLWDANTAECIGSRDFYRPIASIAFHAQGELLAVASGHKLYIWHYNKRGETPSPTIVLRTRRSLRAVHFHPHAAQFLLTAEVNDLDTSESAITLATSPGYVQYPPPTVYFADAHSSDRSSLMDGLPLMSFPLLIWPSFSKENRRMSMQRTEGDHGAGRLQRVDPSASVRLLTYSTPSGQYELVLSPIEPNSSSPVPEETGTNHYSSEMETEVSETAGEASENMEVQTEVRNNQNFPFNDPWELPFLQGWLIGQSQASQHALRPHSDDVRENSSAPSDIGGIHASLTSLIPTSASQSRVGRRSSSRHRSMRSRVPVPVSGSDEGGSMSNSIPDESDPQPIVSRIQSELAASLAAVAAAELPCTVKLRIWSHDVKNPCAPLDDERCRLIIPHAVLCSEMGAHFSPCGRFLAACVACMLPHMEADPGFQSHANSDATGAATSPTRHPISAQQVMYELRIYSLEEATFGVVLASRAIRAAHCLTSIQFSPTSEHLLLAYGRRHSSLLKSVVVDGETTVPIYTILEVYRVSNMELVRVLPSAEDEVNVACFHPSVGGGVVYGTKEGKLRILQYDSSQAINHSTYGFLDENMLEVPTYALEC
ncbi:hypothetical protein IC582_010362 [Cucumis melo]|uniref:Uncharacterized protein LOC103499474 n=1 Tax=Cucumis melo TaxID=3656 RepID=A0A1S3CD53_CUCME|nr:uncharacterized protein LOC103499474 [Cucumis melo]XP_008460709.1 uncharacterized protein LOC103499474 [Cucumis melo]XP_050941394.1 uncharacterized protein LOC103499474 [Cucumis melo]